MTAPRFPAIINGLSKDSPYDSLAQLAEHLTFNQGVRGSNPRWVTSSVTLHPIAPYFAGCDTFLRDRGCYVAHLDEERRSAGVVVVSKEYLKIAFTDGTEIEKAIVQD